MLGCLIEKRWTTPDQYPLSLNGLRLACNQSTNRDPVTAYDEATVREAAQRLCLYGLARLASGHGSRAVKYRHLAEEALGLDREELAVLAVLLLRGPQTPGELKARTERIAHLESLAEVDRVLTTLGERDYARRLGRRPGQKEDRFEHLLGPAGSGEMLAAPSCARRRRRSSSMAPAATTPAFAQPPAHVPQARRRRRRPRRAHRHARVRGRVAPRRDRRAARPAHHAGCELNAPGARHRHRPSARRPAPHPGIAVRHREREDHRSSRVVDGRIRGLGVADARPIASTLDPDPAITDTSAYVHAEHTPKKQ